MTFAPRMEEECVNCGKVIRTVFGTSEWHEQNDPMPVNGWCDCLHPETALSRQFNAWEKNRHNPIAHSQK